MFTHCSAAHLIAEQRAKKYSRKFERTRALFHMCACLCARALIHDVVAKCMQLFCERTPFGAPPPSPHPIPSAPPAISDSGRAHSVVLLRTSLSVKRVSVHACMLDTRFARIKRQTSAPRHVIFASSTLTDRQFAVRHRRIADMWLDVCVHAHARSPLTSHAPTPKRRQNAITNERQRAFNI